VAENLRITRAAIHPGIGIARVGDSPQDYFLGPDTLHLPPRPEGYYKDAGGFLKRQAARFRIFGYDAAGQVVCELTDENAKITWIVHVANKKAYWYEFQVAMDIPEAVAVPRRNANLTGAQRNRLVIDPGPRSISGQNQSGEQYHFDTGAFMGRQVYLGELRTDEAGRLTFLGGHGVSGAVSANNTAIAFGNNDGWFDDTSDGPVTATVQVDGREIPVDPAWVVVAPPNYAPEVVSIVTMYDLMVDTFQQWWLKPLDEISFSEHIQPILQQFCQAQWVNYGFYVQFGWDGPMDFLRSSYFAKLSSNAPEYQEVRRQLFNVFRNPDYKSAEEHTWPQIYGDNMTVPGTDARQYLTVTATQYSWLKLWRDGKFKADWNPAQPQPNCLDDMPLAQRPSLLDRASLHYCLGGPFHPGCEMTWPMRNVSLYYAPFRLRVRTPDNPEPDYGDLLNPAVIKNTDGPLAASGPGDITRWMAIPWQTDTASCRAGYESDYDPYLPTFWPARVPNHVLTAKDYATVMNRSLPLDQRMEAFARRASWYRVLDGQYVQQINQMVQDFSKLGVVERRPGPGDSAFPETMLVESTPGANADVPHDRNLTVGYVGKGRHFARMR
jgi:hypothetical protein